MAEYKLSLKNIELAAGEVTLLYGPSGSGKTSFLMGLLGLLPAEYQLKLPQADSHKEIELGALEAKDKNCAVVFQFDNLFNHLNVYKNLQLVQSKDTSDSDFKEQLESYELEALFEKKANILSGGEQQMVACVRLFLQNSKNLVLLDEPWSSMDPVNKMRYRSLLLKHIKDFNIPALVVSHDEKEAKLLSPKFSYDFNQVAFFEKGHP